jgi:hypothetical protein
MKVIELIAQAAGSLLGSCLRYFILTCLFIWTLRFMGVSI